MEALPNELQGIITSQFSKEDLRNFCLASKSYAQIGAEHLFRTFYIYELPVGKLCRDGRRIDAGGNSPQNYYYCIYSSPI